MSASLKFGALLLALAAIASPATAAPRDHGDRHGRHDQYDGRHDRRDAYRNGYRDGRHDGRRVVHYRDRDYRHGHRDYRAPRTVYYAPPRYYAPRTVVVHRGPPPWARGARYYGPGYGPTYVVQDWHGHGLRRPPPGYYWRRSDAGDFLLVAVATGIIADILLHH
jgi:Ni/Co efflux regulator RcnB